MQTVPYLTFKGDCREAFTFYEKCFGGKIVAMFTFGEAPEGQCGGGSEDWIMHACLQLGANGMLMASDCPADQYETPRGVCVSLHPETPEEAERIFHALEDGGTVVMPIQETFWASRFGMVNDRFGIPWMINCSKQG